MEKVRPLHRRLFEQELAKLAGITYEEGRYVVNALENLVKNELATRGVVRIPGAVEIKNTVRPAKPERRGINPWTKQPCTFKAKPAKNILKFKPARTLAAFMAAHPIEASDAVPQVSDDAPRSESDAGGSSSQH